MAFEQRQSLPIRGARSASTSARGGTADGATSNASWARHRFF